MSFGQVPVSRVSSRELTVSGCNNSTVTGHGGPGSQVGVCELNATASRVHLVYVISKERENILSSKKPSCQCLKVPIAHHSEVAIAHAKVYEGFWYAGATRSCCGGVQVHAE